MKDDARTMIHRAAVVVRDRSIANTTRYMLGQSNTVVRVACARSEIPYALSESFSPDVVVADVKGLEMATLKPCFARLLRLATGNAALVLLTLSPKDLLFPVVMECDLRPAVCKPFPMYPGTFGLFPGFLDLVFRSVRVNRAVRDLRNREEPEHFPETAFLMADLASHSNDVFQAEAAQELEFLASFQDDYLSLGSEILLAHGSEAPCARKGDEMLVVCSQGRFSPLTGKDLHPLSAVLCAAFDLREARKELESVHNQLLAPLRKRYAYKFHVGIALGEAYRLRRACDALEYFGTGPIRSADLCAEDKECIILVDADSFDESEEMRDNLPQITKVEVFVDTKRGLVRCYELSKTPWGDEKCLLTAKPKS